MAKENTPQQKGQPKEHKGPPPGNQPQPKKQQAKGTPAPKPAREEGPSVPPPPPRLRNFYREHVVPDLMKKFGYKTVMQVPRVSKITLNMGVGETTTDKKILDNAVADMTRIAGQKPVVTKARKSIANFKVRAGFPVGCMVTLRGARMYEFLDRLVNIAIPRIRDFRGGSSRAFDGRGHYSLRGIEQIIFPRIQPDKNDALRGLGIPSGGTAKTNAEARPLIPAVRVPVNHLGKPCG